MTREDLLDQLAHEVPAVAVRERDLPVEHLGTPALEPWPANLALTSASWPKARPPSLQGMRSLRHTSKSRAPELLGSELSEPAILEHATGETHRVEARLRTQMPGDLGDRARERHVKLAARRATDVSRIE